jgi:excisionase family DNA binding protein
MVAANQPSQVKVIHGACDAEFDLAGASVGNVRTTLVDVFNISADAVAFLNGKRVDRSYRLRGGERLEFVKPWGRKSACEPEGKLLTVKEAADELRCSISFVYKLMETGRIAFERRGRRKLPLAASISEYRQMSRVEAPSQPPADRSPKQPYQFQRLFQGRRN